MVAGHMALQAKWHGIMLPKNYKQKQINTASGMEVTLCNYVGIILNWIIQTTMICYRIICMAAFHLFLNPWTGDQPVSMPLSTQTENKRRHTYMHWVGFEPTILVFMPQPARPLWSAPYNVQTLNSRIYFITLIVTACCWPKYNIAIVESNTMSYLLHAKSRLFFIITWGNRLMIRDYVCVIIYMPNP
jgi:hypothetical protein